MLGKQRIHNLCDGNCETTFKNLLRGPEKMLSPQKEYKVVDLKETRVSPRNDKNYNKFWNKLQSSNERCVNIEKKKYIANYVKGELRSNINFNPSPQDIEDKKYSIRTMSQIQKQNPNILKDSKDDRYQPKRNSVSKVKMIKNMYQKNPIPHDINLSQGNIDFDTDRPKKTRNYLDSSTMKQALEIPHPENATFAVRKAERSEMESQMIFEQSKAVNPNSKKFLKNRVHLFDGGAAGYYA